MRPLSEISYQSIATCTVQFPTRDLLFDKPGFSHSIFGCVPARTLRITPKQEQDTRKSGTCRTLCAGEHSLAGHSSSSTLPCLRPVPLLGKRQENKRLGAVWENTVLHEWNRQSSLCPGLQEEDGSSSSMRKLTFCLVPAWQTSRHGTPWRYHYDP